MSSDVIPFPKSYPGASPEVIERLRSDLIFPEGHSLNRGPALDPMKFEAEVLKVCNPKPEIRHQLLSFVQHHAPGTSVVRGEIDGFNWQTGVLTLAKETAKGEGMRALLTVAHECGHANQKRDWPWLPWWLVKTPGISMWIENNAWHRALQMLT